MNRVFAEHNRRRHRPKSSLFKPEVQLFDRTFANVNIFQNLPDKTINWEYVRWWWIILFICNFVYNLLTSIYLFLYLCPIPFASFCLFPKSIFYISYSSLSADYKRCAHVENYFSLNLARKWNRTKKSKNFAYLLSLYSFGIKTLLSHSHIFR